MSAISHNAMGRDFFVRISRNTPALIGSLLLLAGIGVALAFWENRQGSQEASAQGALFNAWEQLTSESAGLKPEEQVDVDAKFSKSVAAFTSVADQYSGSRAAFQARLALGDLYFDHGMSAKAVPWYESARQGARSNLEKGLVSYSLGYALENSGDAKSAVAAFETALKYQSDQKAVGGLKADLLMALGRSHEKLGQPAQAGTYYDRVIAEHADSQQAIQAEVFKSRLK